MSTPEKITVGDTTYVIDATGYTYAESKGASHYLGVSEAVVPLIREIISLRAGAANMVAFTRPVQLTVPHDAHEIIARAVNERDEARRGCQKLREELKSERESNRQNAENVAALSREVEELRASRNAFRDARNAVITQRDEAIRQRDEACQTIAKAKSAIDTLNAIGEVIRQAQAKAGA